MQYKDNERDHYEGATSKSLGHGHIGVRIKRIQELLGDWSTNQSECL
jgi:hypothetical protein